MNLNLLRNTLRPIALLGFLTFSAITVTHAAEGHPSKPNIVLFVADDHGAVDIGAHGSTNVRTPNLDRLAAEGMRFSRAYTPASVCGPTRAALYSGMYPVRSKAYFNHPSHYVKEGTRTLPIALRELGYRVGIYNKIDAGPVSLYPFEMLEDEAAIAKFIARDATQPFCLIYGSGKPHVPWKAGEGRVDPKSITVPGDHVDTPRTRECLAAYYGCVELLDDEVGAAMETLRKAGVFDQALFLFTSEHGSQIYKGKGTLYDSGIRLSVIARWPGRIAPGAVSDAIIEHIDFLPTLVDAAAGAPLENIDGKSFLPILRGEPTELRSAAFGAIDDHRSVTTRQFKYIRNLDPDSEKKGQLNPWSEKHPDHMDYVKTWLPLAESDPEGFAAERISWFKKRAPEELYDLTNDPWETRNLAANPEYAGKLQELRTMCDAWMESQGDQGMGTVKELKRWQNGQRAREGFYQRAGKIVGGKH